ncbi:MAG: hypothetical protein SPL80_03750 [Bacilli bacterium]|nr:hypothetical protein [Bacilli bacterium]
MREDESLSYKVVDRLEALFNSRRQDPCRYRFEVFAYPDEKVVEFLYKGIECEQIRLSELRNLLYWAVQEATKELGYGWRVKYL